MECIVLVHLHHRLYNLRVNHLQFSDRLLDRLQIVQVSLAPATKNDESLFQRKYSEPALKNIPIGYHCIVDIIYSLRAILLCNAAPRVKI